MFITESALSISDLLESEERYRALFESNPQPMWVYDTETLSFIAVNEAATRHYGYSREEFLSMTLKDIRPIEDVSALLDSVSRRSAEELMPRIRRHRKKDGTIIDVEITSHTLTFGGRQARLVLANDITERKRAEQALRESEQRYRELTASAFDGIVLHQDGVIRDANRAYAEMYGYSVEELIGRDILKLTAPEYRPLVLAHIRSGIACSYEALGVRADGTRFNIEVSSKNCLFHGSPARVAAVRNITERKRAEVELREAKEAAEAASRAKSEFLANMSHEIRTPMNGIVGMTELALDTELTAEQREYLGLVKMSADSLLGILNDILDFSKIEAGKLELNHDEFSLQDAVDDVIKALAVRADQKGLELAYYLRPGVPDNVVGDAARLRQILVNLVGNAIKFTECGEVIVRIDVDDRTDEEATLHFSVRDTGIGVPPDKQTMIFEAFTQADGSTTRKYGGTGLGLAISSQLVRMMSGQIWVESPSNHGLCNGPPHDMESGVRGPGSMFHFTARVGLNRSTQSITHQKELSELIGLKLLIVDDNATNRRILEVQAGNWRMQPTAVEGGEAALLAIKQAAAAGSPFKLALLDFHMPGMDGLTLAGRMKKMPEGRDVKIIVISSSAQQSDAQYRNRGICGGLLKPVKAAELLNLIRTVLGSDVRQEARLPKTNIKSARPSRVLVAEDSRVNQELIRRLLEKWGHVAVIAENGKDALSLTDSQEFQVCLMDLQMPELNGFEVTAAIRERERNTGSHLPIVALTAHAMAGDRERCIEAGMDDYVSKPIEAEKLFDIIESLVNQTSRSRDNGRPQVSALDTVALMSKFDGDLELLHSLSNLFANSSPGQLSEIADAISRSDAEALERGAHRLKGSVANFCARGAVEAAALLERTAKSGDLSAATDILAVLEKEIAQVQQELDSFPQSTESNH